AFEWNAHHDAPTLLGHFEGTVSGPGLHGRHVELPPSPSVAGSGRRGSPRGGRAEDRPGPASGYSPLSTIAGCNRGDLRVRSEAQTQPARWSSTNPVACINA